MKGKLPKRSFLFSNRQWHFRVDVDPEKVVPSFVSVKYFHRNPWVFYMPQKWRFSNSEVKFPSCLFAPLCTKIRGSVYKVHRTLFHDCHNICTSLWHSKSRSKCRSNGRKTLNAWFIHTPCRHIACELLIVLRLDSDFPHVALSWTMAAGRHSLAKQIAKQFFAQQKENKINSKVLVAAGWSRTWCLHSYQSSTW